MLSALRIACPFQAKVTCVYNTMKEADFQREGYAISHINVGTVCYSKPLDTGGEIIVCDALDFPNLTLPKEHGPYLAILYDAPRGDGGEMLCAATIGIDHGLPFNDEKNDATLLVILKGFEEHHARK